MRRIGHLATDGAAWAVFLLVYLPGRVVAAFAAGLLAGVRVSLSLLVMPGYPSHLAGCGDCKAATAYALATWSLVLVALIWIGRYLTA
jgi:hypothetical protein